MKRLKVLVCGTKFGSVYIGALKNMQDRFEIVGILCRGGERSRGIAAELGVPVFTSLEETEKAEIDLACVVVKSSIVGGKGTELAKYFLERGISVFQEQPVHYGDYAECVKTAMKNKCVYRMNCFYNNVPSVYEFIKTAQKLSENTAFMYLNAECSIQVFFPLVDIIGRVLGGFRPWKIDCLNADTEQSPFAVLTGSIKNTPVMISIKNEMDMLDPESTIPFLQRLTLGTVRGTLQLTDVHGEVLWTPVIHNELNNKSEAEMRSIRVQERIFPAPEMGLGDIMEKLWPKSMERGFMETYDAIVNGKDLSKEHQHCLFMCQLWKEIGTKIGGYHNVKLRCEKPISPMEEESEEL